MTSSESLFIVCVAAAVAFAAIDLVSGRLRARAGRTAVMLTAGILGLVLYLSSLKLSTDQFPEALLGVLVCVVAYVISMMRASGRTSVVRRPEQATTPKHDKTAPEPPATAPLGDLLVLRWDRPETDAPNRLPGNSASD